MFLLNLLAGETGGDSQTFNPTTLIILGVFIVIIVVMSIFNNKQRKKQMAEEQQKKDSLCPGTKVITIGGIMGTVVSVDNEESSFVLESAGNNIKFDKRAIYQITLPETAEEEKVVEKEAEEESTSDKAE